MVTRLTADERKRQLIGIGLQLLVSVPVDEVSLDQVAHRAGISRSLLFHHFPTKRDYYLAVVRAASRRMVHAVDVPRDGEGAVQLRAMCAGMVAFIRRRRGPYLTFVRGAGGGDAAVSAIKAEVRDELVDRFAAECALAADDAAGRLQVRGWLAYAEELILVWTGEQETDERDPELVELLLTALDRLLGR